MDTDRRRPTRPPFKVTLAIVIAGLSCSLTACTSWDPSEWTLDDDRRELAGARYDDGSGIEPSPCGACEDDLRSRLARFASSPALATDPWHCRIEVIGTPTRIGPMRVQVDLALLTRREMDPTRHAIALQYALYGDRRYLGSQLTPDGPASVVGRPQPIRTLAGPDDAKVPVSGAYFSMVLMGEQRMIQTVQLREVLCFMAVYSPPNTLTNPMYLFEVDQTPVRVKIDSPAAAAR